MSKKQDVVEEGGQDKGPSEWGPEAGVALLDPMVEEKGLSPGRRPKVRGPEPFHTQEEWLVEAKEVEAVMARGDHVSPELVEMLFLDALGVIEAIPPAGDTRKKKENDDKVGDARNDRKEDKADEKRGR